ncbi:aminodeoxychorismate synthase component I [Sphingosinicella sp.]|uniref:aminodeoxychorismate synthase component I n=1 Tax=Sphingosinicella sp. TaxID=1917971 RepID=UPI00403796EC
MTRPDGPFVLLDDARPGGETWLHAAPREIVAAREPAEVRDGLARLRGKSAAGFIAYAAGYALEPKLAPLAGALGDDAPPLLWFGLFDRIERIDPATFLPDPAGGWLSRPRPLVEAADYRAAVRRILDHVLAGDVYQANLTFQAEVMALGDPLALYAGLRRRARAGHGALVFTGDHWLLSGSPELFFTLKDGRVTTRPMKGTAPPGSDPAALSGDAKNRAENLMIVDLLRNDLSKLARPGSVKVPALFEVETYPTVLQMISTVTAELEDGRDAIDLLEAIFPCGSITGAPKIRAMEIIAGLEPEPRGVYCGAIGALEADGAARFNVAIRTLTLRAGETQARIGLGSGIVADSDPDGEWRECLAKGAFVASRQRFDLIETMAFDPLTGLARLDRHLERMKRSAEAFDFRFDRHEARNELQAATFRAAPSLVRLALSPSGAMAIEIRPLPVAPEAPAVVALAPLPVSPQDFRLRHKTSDRAHYDEARANTGAFELLFVDPDGFLTEGSFTSLFVERDGKLLTPPLARGLLPGVLREELIERTRAVEADLRPGDLAGGFWIGNSARGLIRARLASAGSGVAS